VEFVVYRRDTVTAPFDSVTTVSQTSYRDQGLEMLKEDCYYVEARGIYSWLPGLDTLINKSQITCAETIDSVPPCAPLLSLESDCDLDQNVLDWDYNTDTCDADVVGYEVYFTPSPDGDFLFLEYIDGIGNTSYTDINTESLAGCYAVLAVD